jgi:hypothetical protein
VLTATIDRAVAAIFAILAAIRAVEDCFLSWSADFSDQLRTYVDYYFLVGFTGQLEKPAV